jgi:hypothetical protein
MHAISTRMDFESDICEFVLDEMEYDPQYRAELEQKPASELLAIYFNWWKRLVRLNPRTVHKSAELKANPLSGESPYAEALQEIIQRIETGKNLTRYLSERIKHGYEPAKAPGTPLIRRQDLDLMLYDWDVHHLHLCTKLQPDGIFVERTKPLLFAVFKKNDAYLVDIVEKHGAWARNHVFEVMIENWPNAGLVYHRPSIIDVPTQPSESDRAKLRSAGINSGIVMHKGKAYSVGTDGLASNGMSIQAVRSANAMLLNYRGCAAHIEANPTYVRDAIETGGRTLVGEPDLHAFFPPTGGYGVLERSSKVYFPIRPPD